MIKLVSQFDNEKSELSLATPTCGCCSCCCCCCIITTLSAANISARYFTSSALKVLPKEPEKIKKARVYGFWFPMGLVASFFLGILLNVFLKISDGIIFFVPPILSIIIYSIIMGNSIRKKTNSPEVIINIIFVTIITAFLEAVGVYLGMLLVFFLNVLYLLVAPIIGFIIFEKTFKDNFDNLEPNKKNDDDEVLKSDENKPEINTIDIKIKNNEITEIPLEKKIPIQKKIKMKKCPKCGNKNNEVNKRCFYCSHIFEEDK